MKRMMYDIMVTVMLIVTIFGGATIARLINNNYIREGIVMATHASNEEVIVVDTTGKVNGHGVYLKKDINVIEIAKTKKILERENSFPTY